MKPTPFKFEIGDEVIIKDPGCNFPGAKELAIEMGATNWISGMHDGYYDSGDRAVILNRATNTNASTKVYLIKVNEGQHVIGEKGLEHLLKGILKYEK